MRLARVSCGLPGIFSLNKPKVLDLDQTPRTEHAGTFEKLQRSLVHMADVSLCALTLTPQVQNLLSAQLGLKSQLMEGSAFILSMQ